MPIIALSKVAFLIFELVWIILFFTVLSSITVPSPMETYGPTVLFLRITPSAIKEGSNIFENTGSGIMFVPSGLGYYNSGSASIPAYSTLVFSFNLNTLRYRDHDKDGIPSYLEVENIDDDPRKYDTDNDGTPNYLDIDDDNDGKITRGEITDPDGNIYPFDLIPVCASGKKIHIDPDLSCND